MKWFDNSGSFFQAFSYVFFLSIAFFVCLLFFLLKSSFSPPASFLNDVYSQRDKMMFPLSVAARTKEGKRERGGGRSEKHDVAFQRWVKIGRGKYVNTFRAKLGGNLIDNTTAVCQVSLSGTGYLKEYFRAFVKNNAWSVKDPFSQYQHFALQRNSFGFLGDTSGCQFLGKYRLPRGCE